MNNTEINICHLYPDLLNLYGDTGNILCLKKRMEDRNIKCNITGLSVGDKLNPELYDIFFLGGGQDFEQDVLLSDAAKNKKDGIKQAIESEKVLLAVCGGYQILGKYYKTWDGQTLEFMGCLDFYTVGDKKRMIGNYMFQCDELDGYEIVGFENHSGKTFLGEGLKPIGKVLYGNGNNGIDGYEGLHYKNLFATYSHGPVLPKNPKFCDLLIEKAVTNKYGYFSPEPLDDTFEENAHNYMKQRLSK